MHIPRACPPRHKDDGGWRVKAEKSGGGHFLDIGSHALDLLDSFFGPLSDVAGVAGNHGESCLVEDTVAMSFLAGGIPGEWPRGILPVWKGKMRLRSRERRDDLPSPCRATSHYGWKTPVVSRC
jgi:predicted dehydrogenase